ncbi:MULTISPECIES: GH3 auxin-responsive promoter family protein [Maribacter]|uniref:GH3 auxin-responsive promoter family protein n=1 Tax=Maribacter flavus TaxID=1658664 RepID=A0A5B2U004_9FLAO|nr:MULTISPECIES: GH3 auxin-responsive promoter family protein [Maribacter]KAA2219260.1 GH3 auxin-responsive promoter family protein [Maribacter flavus]MDC6404194.1 GH3 auxin-responsive promoter family protein [Maribacter sp. PR66]MEE1971337.1 GH3 auxin-responsive promoter family protein [Maribacter flavus]
MSLKAFAAKIFAKRIVAKTQKWVQNPHKTQQRVFKELVAKGSGTKFGEDHDFNGIQTHQDFVERVPVRDYEELKSYVHRVVDGEPDILWPGKPIYFAKTSGTTSGAKYIPITKESIKHQVEASRNAILSYIHETGRADFVDGKMIFLQGSPELTEKNGIKLGRLSGISAHYVPNYLQKNRLPSWETNCIEDWETKVNTIVEETKDEDMTVIAGIPSWVQMYFEKLKEKTNRNIGDLFPNFELFIYGGVNYEPYRKKFEELIGRKVASIELFPASEGFFAYQDSQMEKGMLLLLNSGILYEFIRIDDFHKEEGQRLTIEQVEKDVDYVMIISTNAGLWAYNLGDTVRFVSLEPYKVVVSGRVKHFISAFGEHVIAKEVEEAMQTAMNATDAKMNEFTVAPQITPENEELPYHEWFVEFEKEPSDMNTFKRILDESLQQQNSYYFDLIEGKVLQPLKITRIRHNGFKEYMKSMGKLGGQNKVQRLANDRSVADKLKEFMA